MKAYTHLNWLGQSVREKVTGIEGFVLAVSFDLYGCVQAEVKPVGTKSDGKPWDSAWYDVSRLKEGSHLSVDVDTPSVETLRSHLQVLGKRTLDRISGVECVIDGVYVTVSPRILYGANYGTNDKGESLGSFWLEVCNAIVSDEVVMDCPNYEFGVTAEGKQGSAERPAY